MSADSTLTMDGSSLTVGGSTLTSTGGTLTVDGCTPTIGSDILTSDNCTLTSDGCTLMVDHHIHQLPRTIDQKWIAGRMFNWDSEFRTHANTEKEPCVSVYFILYFLCYWI
jgi:hypothetical protein